MNDSWVDAYLTRIGAERPARADDEALRELHLRHLLTVPFENLGICVFCVAETPRGDLEVSKDGTPEYRLETRPQTLRDFRTGCWWHRTSPESHFTRSLVCSMLTGFGRITLSGRTLIRTVNGERDERELDGDTEVLDAYRTWFGIDLDRVPQIESRAATA